MQTIPVTTFKVPDGFYVYQVSGETSFEDIGFSDRGIEVMYQRSSVTLYHYKEHQLFEIKLRDGIIIDIKAYTNEDACLNELIKLLTNDEKLYYKKKKIPFWVNRKLKRYREQIELRYNLCDE